MREPAVRVLGKFGEHAKDAVPTLTEYLKEGDSVVRSSAAKVLGKLGEHAKYAVPALTECSKDSNSDVRSSAAQALRSLDENALPASSEPLMKCPKIRQEERP